MSINLISKLLINVLIFAVIARFISITDFGKLMYFYTLANIISMIVDYGFNLYTVKEMAKNRDSWQRIFKESLNSKVLLTLICIGLLVPIVIIFQQDIFLIIIFFLVGVFNSYINYFLLPFRIIDNYKFETSFSVFSNLALFLLVVICAVTSKNLILISLAFLISRFLVFFIEILIIKRKLRISFSKQISFRDSFQLLKRNMPYGLHLIVGTIYFQIDTIVLKYFSDFTNIAIYQSSFRIVMAGLVFTEVISNILLPKVSTLKSNDLINSYTKKANIVLLVFGLVIGLFLFVSSDIIIKLMYGEHYGDSVIILKVLCFMLVFRYMTTIDGVILTVLDKQSIRTIIAFIAIIINLILSIVFVREFGALGAALASLLTSFILLIIYKLSTKILLKNKRKVCENEY